jgi:arylsulfatase A-like enzyme
VQGDMSADTFAVRSGPWKLIESKAGAGGRKHQLYDLVNDPGESKNLAADQAGVVKEIAEALAKVRENGNSRP